MKRYKVVRNVILGYTILPDKADWRIDCFIPAGTEICLEEVKEERVNCRDCWYEGRTCTGHNDQPKEERKCSHPFWDCKGTGNWDDDGLKCTCECESCRGKDQPKEEEQAIVGEQKDICGNAIAKDKPLTPKDVGLTKGKALLGFYNKFLNTNYRGCVGKTFSKLDDEEFDRLFQQFLSEYKR